MSIDPNVAYWGDRCCKAEAEVERLQAALKPLAAIPLWCDTYPDAKQDRFDCHPDCRLTVEDVRRARAALGEQQDPKPTGPP